MLTQSEHLLIITCLFWTGNNLKLVFKSLVHFGLFCAPPSFVRTQFCSCSILQKLCLLADPSRLYNKDFMLGSESAQNGGEKQPGGFIKYLFKVELDLKQANNFCSSMKKTKKYHWISWKVERLYYLLIYTHHISTEEFSHF